MTYHLPVGSSREKLQRELQIAEILNRAKKDNNVFKNEEKNKK